MHINMNIYIYVYTSTPQPACHCRGSRDGSRPSPQGHPFGPTRAVLALCHQVSRVRVVILLWLVFISKCFKSIYYSFHFINFRYQGYGVDISLQLYTVRRGYLVRVSNCLRCARTRYQGYGGGYFVMDSVNAFISCTTEIN